MMMRNKTLVNTVKCKDRFHYDKPMYNLIVFL
jgi:hypothetical protein